MSDRSRTASATGGTDICSACGLTGGPFEPDEARYFIGLHNDLHHGGYSPVLSEAS